MTSHDRHERAALPRRKVLIPLRRPARLIARGAAHITEDAPASRIRFLFAHLYAQHRRLIARLAIGIGVLCLLIAAGGGALWWQLGSGPVQLDAVTPWLASAIADNFGSNHRVEIGGTQIERTENGGMAVRIRDIVVRDADGAVVASAPKAEVRLSGLGLLRGHLRAESLNLVGTAMAVRIEPDGGVTVFAGPDKRPIATASVPTTAAAALLRSAQGKRSAATESAAPNPRSTREAFSALLSWIDGIGQTGLDGHELRELGLKNGNVTVDDRRTGKLWNFRDINLSVQRAHGGVVVAIGSDNAAQPWSITAAATPTRKGYRKIELQAQHVSVGDLLLASRIEVGNMRVDLPVSVSVGGEIGPDGMPQTFTGRVVVDAGSIVDLNDDKSRIVLDRAEFQLNWDAASRVLSVPFQILSGGNRITLIGQIEAPLDAAGAWLFRIGGGTVVLTSPGPANDPLVLNRIAISGRLDAAKQRFTIEEGDIGNSIVGVAMSGDVDFSGGNPRVAAGLAGTRMPVESLKRLWPAFVNPEVHDWINTHLLSGTVERIVVAANAPLDTLKAGGPPVPDDGLSIEALTTSSVIRPVDGLPPLRDADLNVHIVGRSATVTVAKAAADMPSGRKLALSAGTFEVADTSLKPPLSRVRFKLEGPLPAAAELLHMDALQNASEAPFDPSTIHGNMSAQVTLGDAPFRPTCRRARPPTRSRVDATNFSADHMIMGQKVDAALLRATADAAGLPAQRRRQDRRHAGEPRIPASCAAKPTPKSTFQGSSTRRRAPISASTAASHQRRRSRSGSPATSPPHPIAKAVSPSKPISRRRRSTAFAGLGEAVRQAGARDLHACHQAAGHPHRAIS